MVDLCGVYKRYHANVARTFWVFDPNGRQRLSMAGFHALAGRLREVAHELRESKIIIVREGGYNPVYAPSCAYAVVAGLPDLPIGIPGSPRLLS